MTIYFARHTHACPFVLALKLLFGTHLQILPYVSIELMNTRTTLHIHGVMMDSLKVGAFLENY